MLIDLNYIVSKFSLKINNIAHVGVNNAFEVDTYKKINPKSKIFLVEPQSDIFEKLQKKFINDEQVEVLNYSLGNKTGVEKLHLSNTHKGSASLLLPTLHKKIHPEVKFKGFEYVSIEKFDNLKLENVNFINIDTQGYELNVLRGASKSLKNIDYIIIEINTVPLYKDSALIHDIDEYLYMKGFIRQITVFWDSDCYWGDAFYIKKSSLSKMKIFKINIKNYLIKSKILYNSIHKYKKLFNKIKNFI